MGQMIKNQNYDYSALKNVIFELNSQYPEMRVGSIGKSVLGRDIHYLKFGTGPKHILLAGGFHGSEHITSVIMLKFAEDICRSLNGGLEFQGVNLKRGLAGRSVIIIPRVNPDGCEISISGEKTAFHLASFVRKVSRRDTKHWNANARGVDINHNFDADWEQVRALEQKNGILAPCPSRYGGRHPFSEPESVALRDFCLNNDFSYVLAFHSQGEVIYWSFGKNTPAYSEKMASVLSVSSGYALDVPIGTAVGGGFKDWFISRFCRPGFTVELGKGVNPLPPEDAEKIYTKIKDMLTISIIM